MRRQVAALGSLLVEPRNTEGGLSAGVELCRGAAVDETSELRGRTERIGLALARDRYTHCHVRELVARRRVVMSPCPRCG